MDASVPCFFLVLPLFFDYFSCRSEGLYCQDKLLVEVCQVWGRLQQPSNAFCCAPCVVHHVLMLI